MVRRAQQNKKKKAPDRGNAPLADIAVVEKGLKELVSEIELRSVAMGRFWVESVASQPESAAALKAALRDAGLFKNLMIKLTTAKIITPETAGPKLRLVQDLAHLSLLACERIRIEIALDAARSGK